MKIWSLVDERIGSSRQAITLAKNISNDILIKNIKYNFLINLPNILKFKKTGVDFVKSDNLLNINREDIPDILIFSGRRLAGISLYLKKYFLQKFEKKIFIISILKPDYSYKYFDLIILPYHDNNKKDKYNNIIKINGAICSLEDKKIFEEKEKWNTKLKNLSSPYYSLMIGGDTKNKKLNAKKIGKLINNLSNKVQLVNGTLLISSSRRTSLKCVKEIEKNLKCNNYFHKWNKDIIDNPYFAFIGLADIFIITGDSISMIAEILTTKKPILVYTEKSSLEKKHQRFIENLLEKEMIKVINSDEKNFKTFKTKEINELNTIKNLIFEKIKIEK